MQLDVIVCQMDFKKFSKENKYHRTWKMIKTQKKKPENNRKRQEKKKNYQWNWIMFDHRINWNYFYLEINSSRVAWIAVFW